jgi:hypothetical protein
LALCSLPLPPGNKESLGQKKKKKKESPYLSIEAKGQFCWILYSWLAVILSQSLNNTAPYFLDFRGLADRSEVILMGLPFM